MPEYETPEDEPGVMSARDFLARGKKRNKSSEPEKPQLRPRIVAIEVVGDANSDSIMAAAFLSKLFDREKISYRLEFSGSDQKAAFDAAKSRSLKELAEQLRKLKDIALRHDLVAYRKREDWAESRFDVK